MVTLPCPACGRSSLSVFADRRVPSRHWGPLPGDGVQPARATATAVHSTDDSGKRKQDLLRQGHAPTLAILPPEQTRVGPDPWQPGSPPRRAGCVLQQRPTRIGLDTEFIRERTFWPQLALVQMAVGQDILLIDPLIPGMTEALAPWLADEPSPR